LLGTFVHEVQEEEEEEDEDTAVIA